MPPIRRRMRQWARLSVSDRTGLVDFAHRLGKLQLGLLATDGTFAELQRAGIEAPLKRVSDVTQWPEMLGGRVKSLHPAVFGGILANRSAADDVADMAKHGLLDIRVVAANLYPFPSKPAAANIDIGGSALLRAAAKNSAHVCVFSCPSQYARLDEAVASAAVRAQLAGATPSVGRAGESGGDTPADLCAPKPSCSLARLARHTPALVACCERTT